MKLIMVIFIFTVRKENKIGSEGGNVYIEESANGVTATNANGKT